MNRIPLSNAELAKPRFKDGDKIIIRTVSKLDKYEAKAVFKSLSKYANACVQALLVDISLFTLLVRDLNGIESIIAGMGDETSLIQQGKIRFSCSSINFDEVDRVVVLCENWEAREAKLFKQALDMWVDKCADIEYRTYRESDNERN